MSEEKTTTKEEVKATENKKNEEKPKDKVNGEAKESGLGQVKKTKPVQSNIITPSEVKPGMVIKLWQKIKEKNPKGEIKERLQYFEGTVLARKKGNEAGATITIRKVSNGVGVEKIFPLALPTIEKIELLQKIKTRRAKLYFLKRNYKKRLKKENIA
jgi:large subunit ribosomal protein L19